MAIDNRWPLSGGIRNYVVFIISDETGFVVPVSAALPFIRQVLDPTIVYVGDGKNSLPAIACQTGDTVISVRMAIADKRNPACYFCIRQIAVIVWIDVNHD